MLITSTDILEIILDRAPTSELSFNVYYNEYTSTAVTPNRNSGTTNSITAVSLIPSPSSGNQRQLRWASVFSNSTKDIGVTIRINVGGTLIKVLNVYLKPSETIQYTEERGWSVYDSSGSEKVTGFFRPAASTVRIPENMAIGSAASVTSLVSGTAYCQYLGKAEKAYSSIKIRQRVAVLATTLAWGELAIYEGDPVIRTNTTMNRLGFTNMSTVWGTGGSNNTNVTATIALTGSAMGQNLWAVYAQSAATPATFRSNSSPGDFLGAGYFQLLASTRPSLTSSFTPTIDLSVSSATIAWEGIP